MSELTSVRQDPRTHPPRDSGMACLEIMARMHGVAFDVARLRHEFGAPPLDTLRVLLAARSLGLSAKAIVQTPERLDRAPLPAIAQHRETGKFFVIAQIRTDASSGATRILIRRAGESPEVVDRAHVLDIWTGELILLSSKADRASTMARFDFSWFIPAMVKYRRVLGELVLVSFVLQLIGLATPLLFQVVMDKVLVNHAMRTLHVVVLGLVCATLFEAMLGGLRTWVFAHTSSKIDVELGARLFRHLLQLPIAYFHARRVGDSVARVRELESIRAFLTGHAMTLVMDIVFSFVVFAVMSIYSAALTAIVALSIPFYVLLSIVFTPLIRGRLNEKFNRGAENQSFLVESISGVDTIKSMAVEPRWAEKWDRQLAAYVRAGLAVARVSIWATEGASLLSKLVTASIMGWGAVLVIEQKLTVGELVAFNMLAGQVSGPILRLAQLWNDFQQVGISMGRLGDILNSRPEVAAHKSRLPRVVGTIEFDRVSFRYRADAGDVLRDVTLHVRAGEFVGIVGRSGSGKSTLTRLVQRLYVPDRGCVRVDGHDLAVIDVASLRRQIGVVLQENHLFNRSVRENIALGLPSATLERVMAVAKLAGAHDFICGLPEGYDTIVGEHGVGLSGGQRQRIAIARALITQPRILIFDEATSALDYESERIIQDAMRRICAGRTVLVIAHRLSTVRDANRIVVMDRGQIVEIGTHDALLANTDGIYAGLHRLQQGAPMSSGGRFGHGA
ncbi:type I secretion system permease/ATPase [Pararobbsia silviterrae]|uniref:Cyclolysin secretion/processing ATP-binding protein CyaB n=1 Tax=Pararobbsia silviterrae TaxID=1792498 RepID=A0A494Y8N7_9BURK|nr:type I secretion system permease/ATPase [Pararobbsia silviterrae]RKP56666.1 type I secretion system permease/ATPase [Pararobbsia silviterrae]